MEKDAVVAVYVPTGRPYFAWDVPAASELKLGPWRCAAEGCAVPMTHRVGHPAATPSGGIELKGAAFVCQRGHAHNPAVQHVIPRRAAERVRGIGRNAHIHQIVGVPRPPVEKPSRTRTDGPAASTEDPYGESVRGAAGLLEFSRRAALDPELARTQQFRFGATYWWRELWYPCTLDGITRLRETSRNRFELRGTSFYVEAVVAYRPHINGQRVILNLVHDVADRSVVIHLTMPNTDEFEHIRALRYGDAVALYSNEVWAKPPEDGQGGLCIEQPDQLVRR